MTYAEVGRVLGRTDPGLRHDLKEAVEQERAANQERKQVLAELRTEGVNINPPMRSNVMIDRFDYVLVFNDGVLTSWTPR